MSSQIIGEQAFTELEKTFGELIKAADDVPEILQTGADAFVKDLRAMPSPRSSIKKAGYSHLLDTFATKKEGEGILIGWGKYYGPILEHGSKKMSAKPHFKPAWRRNQNKYYKIMTDKITGGI